ncbi:hypothetical protein HanRHA438_Chr09g0425931 [Helianthus annuus]|nr:hypothetical protein HanRHA438_Chr09g0425931 [Helianthus annuus]
MIERGMCGVRERNGLMGIAPPLQEVPASSRSPLVLLLFHR